MDLSLLYHVPVLASLGLILAQTLANLRFLPAPPPAGPGEFAGEDDAPLVSVLVPARDEAHRIGPCVASLLAQGYPNFELLVLDDHSSDDTAAVVLGLGLTEMDTPSTPHRGRLLRGKPLPPGWTGKAWACHQLAGAARGEWLLFTDADTTHAPGGLAATVAHARRTRADLLSAWPRQTVGTWSERLVIPLVYVLLLGFLPLWLFAWFQRRLGVAAQAPPGAMRRFGAANGQFILFRRAAYDATGGHSAVRAHLVEDVALARLVADRTGAGLRVINCDGRPWVSCRMYGSFPEVWEGFTKNLRAAFEDAAVAFWASGLFQFAVFVLPFALALTGHGGRLAQVEVALIYAIRGVLTWRFRTSLRSWLLHPLGHGLALLIALNSWRRSVGGGVSWKGRVYAVDPVAGK